MSGDLGTTNLLLGIMAAVSALQVLVIILGGVLGFRAYRHVIGVVHGIEARQVAPAMVRVNAILDDVKAVTATVKGEGERVDRAIHTTMSWIDDTAGRLRSGVQAKAGAVVGLVRGVDAAFAWMHSARHDTTIARRRHGR